jgi:cyclopropane fatty-acyl-phospholipid synthase-like methyltransferase
MNKFEIIRSYYEPKLDADIPDYEKLGWESASAQYSRFAAFADNVQLEGKSLLDVGCGLGNLLEYLTLQKVDVKYTGVDILCKMIEQAKNKNLNGEFHCIDIFKDDPFADESFDVVYASGIFNLNLGNNKDFFSDALCHFGSMARSIVAFNLLDHRSPNREDKYFYFSPVEVLDYIENLSCRPRKVQIVEQYLKNDFTVICEK